MDEEKKGKNGSNWGRILARFNWLGRHSKPSIPENRQPIPEYHAGFFSLLTFSWMSPILATGYRRQLEVNDIWLINPNRRSRDLAAKLKASFQENHRNSAKRPLARALFQTFKTDMMIGGLAAFISSMIQVLVPFVVKYIITYAVQDYEARLLGIPGPAIGKGVGLVLSITIMQIFGSMGYNHFFYRGMLVGGQVRSALISMIFDKAMTISGRAKAGGEAWGNGRIVNLMSVDTSRIDQASGWFHMIWAAPLSLVVTIVLLLINLSYSALVGLALFFTATPLVAYIVRAMLKRREKINRDTDERITIMQEALQAIRFVKYYAWEDDFLKRLGAVRRREIRGIRYLLGHRNMGIAIGSTIPIFSSMLTFITSSLTNHALEPASTFSSLALFNQLRLPLIMFPMVIGLVSDALQSLTRIEQFFLAEDSMEMGVECMDGLALNLLDASFTWEKSTPPNPNERLNKGNSPSAKPRGEKTKEKEINLSSKTAAQEKTKGINIDVGKTPAASKDELETQRPPFILNNINLQVYPSELIAVVGSVGSGKTSLLSAIAGDMRRISGTLQARGKRAFCAQVAWIQNATIRDNITFGHEFVEEEYDRVVEACSLDYDLQILPHGSFTEIGERGINLSGGQKQRVSLARAVYSGADVFLLDDPLGAVDAHVGAHIMEHAICGLLKDKCRILVTHQLHVLPRCDRIIIMDKGRVIACDSFENLMASNATFQRMMTSVTTQEREDEVLETEEVSTQQKSSQKAQEALVLVEDHQINGISKAVYLDYWKSTGSLLIPPFVLLILLVAQGGNIMTNLWLAWWSDNKFGLSTGVYIGVYSALGVSQGLLLLLAALGFTIFGTEASKNMLHRAVQRILRAPISFFDTTPLGRIMNRFSKDIDVMDNNLTESMRSACTTVSMLISIIILTIAYYYYFAIALVPLCIFYFACAVYYRSSALEIKRHESVFRSAVFAHFNEAIVGTATIRAYGMQTAFSTRLTDAIDDMDAAYYLTFANQRWLGVRLDVIGVVFLVVTGLLVVTNRFAVAPSISGLVLSYLVSITQTLLLAVRQVADAQNNMNAVERVHYYSTSIVEEAPAETMGLDLPASWPERGHISFRDVRMRYREGLPMVLHGLSIEVQAGERLGIVGRTGAGKSSVMVALFRMVELAGGSIVIDGIDINSVGLKDLRGRLSIIPQDPALFRGTVRTNLDPFGRHSDLDLWTALRRAHLVDDGEVAKAVDQEGEESRHSRITLETVVEADGANFSLGQRQLMGLARALVRDSRIIVFDEATSSIDFESDLRVQETIAEGFKGRTVLCIAHRLKTIMGYDRVCVIDNGRVAELGTPLELYDGGGKFRAMCEQSQITREEIELARKERGVDI
ncbi:P-loop containing nucleoside triphosphate hydrolase protein [Glonium stellatum]|uniref:P-loop containing nucleoside triphosphate hydrolase protein n=1 Tax=Glonium stellatum TaxID=574774 RepID=A0A8E2EWA1_9PEZI|nr:P-loop containing nucleoside triphosphate hydrolase protein [Glonium stellatum]